MIKLFTHKMGALLGSNHSECGAMQLTNQFIKANSVAGNTTAASLIAAIPCMRYIASLIKASWRVCMGKIV